MIITINITIYIILNNKKKKNCYDTEAAFILGIIVKYHFKLLNTIKINYNYTIIIVGN